MKSYRTVLFDLFDTIVDFHLDRLPVISWEGKPIHSTAGAVYDVFRTIYPAIAFDVFYGAFRESRRQLEAQRRETLREFPSQVRFRRMLEMLGLDAASDDVIERLVEAHMGEWAKGAEMPPGHRSLLERARRHVRLGIVSNFDHSPTALRILQREGIRSLFDVIVISADAGWRKPHPEIFLQALTALKSAPAEVLFVGDTFEADVVGAKGVGMDAVWLNRRGEPLPDAPVRPDYIVSQLGDLDAILPSLVEDTRHNR